MKKTFFASINSFYTRSLIFAIASSCAIFPIEGQQTSSQFNQLNADQAEEEEKGIVSFTPPTGWMLADAAALPPRVKVMVIGKGASNFPPSLNLSCEPYKGSLKEYLKIVKNMNVGKGYEWKDLGTIQTQAGMGSLSQVDTKTQWGDVRFMHVILIKNDQVYILTASALKNEFSSFYQDFFDAMRSLKIIKDVYEMITHPQQRAQLKIATEKLQTQWHALLILKQKEKPTIAWKEIQESTYNSEDFQNSVWNLFKTCSKKNIIY